MAWKCVICNRPEPDVRVNGVCHHCGKPLCDEHAVIVNVDDAFSGMSRPLPRSSVHCEGCQRTHHPRATTDDWELPRTGVPAGHD